MQITVKRFVVNTKYIFSPWIDIEAMRRLFLTFLIFLVLLQCAQALPEPITPGVEPSFSNDGTMIVYSATHRGLKDIFYIDRAGNKKQVTSDIFWDGQPAFTQNDRAIIFVSDRSGNRELWQTDLDGENLRQLTSGDGWKSSPAVSRDGRIAFTSGRHPDLDIFILEKGLTQRITFLEDEIYSPTWSPDGKRISFVINGELVIINSDGTGMVKLDTGVYTRGISWGIDGRILYLKRKLGYDLWSVDSKNPGKKELIYEGVTDSWEVNPSISSLSEIAFSTDKDGVYRIYKFKVQIPPAIFEALPSANPASAANPSTIENKVELSKTEKVERYSKEGEPKEDLEIDPDMGREEIKIPEESYEGKDEIILPDEPQVNDEIIIPDPAISEEREPIIAHGYFEFFALAYIALFALLAYKRARRELNLGI